MVGLTRLFKRILTRVICQLLKFHFLKVVTSTFEKFICKSCASFELLSPSNPMTGLCKKLKRRWRVDYYWEVDSHLDLHSPEINLDRLRPSLKYRGNDHLLPMRMRIHPTTEKGRRNKFIALICNNITRIIIFFLFSSLNYTYTS